MSCLLQSRKQWILALSHLQQARHIVQDHPAVDTKYAELLFHCSTQDRPQQQQTALQLLDQLIATRRDRRAALYQRACLYLELRQYQQAERDLRTLLKLAPEERSALALLARVTSQSKQTSTAIDCLIKLHALSSHPDQVLELNKQIQMLSMQS